MLNSNTTRHFPDSELRSRQSASDGDHRRAAEPPVAAADVHASADVVRRTAQPVPEETDVGDIAGKAFRSPVSFGIESFTLCWARPFQGTVKNNLQLENGLAL